MQQLITIGSLALGAISAACFLLMAYLYYRNEQLQKNRLKRAEADMSDMMLLFQTMRDVVRQQKELARDFNQTLESKMGAVKHILGRSLEKNERLYEKQQVLAQELEEAKAQLESLQRQSGYLREAVRHGNGTNAAARLAALADEVYGERRQPATPPQAPAQATPPRILPDEESLIGAGRGAANDFEQWGGEDLEPPYDVNTDRTDPDPRPDSQPVPPSEHEAARDAFRSLLDLSGETGDSAPAEAPAQSNGTGSDLSPMQKRVLDYSNAGMAVADIARELGIGKGEVRLMLSLARQSQVD